MHQAAEKGPGVMTGAAVRSARGLRAGPLEVDLDGVRLTAVRRGPAELLRGGGYYVRDPEWGTTAARVTRWDLHAGADTFLLQVAAVHDDEAVGWSWEGTIEGRQDGTLHLQASGFAIREFSYNRIGWVLLLPPACAGRPYQAHTAAGWTGGTLPSAITYWPLFPDFDMLTIDPRGPGEFSAAFTGDRFEVEDQRNWTDASFKIYGTPVRPGGPFTAAAGTRLEQTAEVRVPATVPLCALPDPIAARSLAQASTGWFPRPRPRIGALAPPDDLIAAGTAAAGTPQPDHLRVELNPANDPGLKVAGRAMRLAGDSQVPVELAVLIRADQLNADLWATARFLQQHHPNGPQIARVVVLGDGDATATRTAVAAVRAVVASQVPVGGATSGHFADLNRDRPDTTGWDGIGWSMCPQVHDVDDVSVMRTIGVQRLILDTAHRFAGGAGLWAGPVTLQLRHRLATVTAGPDIDVRLHTAFGAAWTLGTVVAAILGGAEVITVHEWLGPRGWAGTGATRPLAAVLGTILGLHDILDAGLAGEAGHAWLTGRTPQGMRVHLLADLSGDGLDATLVSRHTPGRRHLLAGEYRQAGAEGPYAVVTSGGEAGEHAQP